MRILYFLKLQQNLSRTACLEGALSYRPVARFASASASRDGRRHRRYLAKTGIRPVSPTFAILSLEQPCGRSAAEMTHRIASKWKHRPNQVSVYSTLLSFRPNRG